MPARLRTDYADIRTCRPPGRCLSRPLAGEPSVISTTFRPRQPPPTGVDERIAVPLKLLGMHRSGKQRIANSRIRQVSRSEAAGKLRTLQTDAGRQSGVARSRGRTAPPKDVAKRLMRSSQRLLTWPTAAARSGAGTVTGRKAPDHGGGTSGLVLRTS